MLSDCQPLSTSSSICQTVPFFEGIVPIYRSVFESVLDNNCSGKKLKLLKYLQSFLSNIKEHYLQDQSEKLVNFSAETTPCLGNDVHQSTFCLAEF